jgi:hypothetical protein
METAVLLTGLAGIGYVINKSKGQTLSDSNKENFVNAQNIPLNPVNAPIKKTNADEVKVIYGNTGHSNMTPFYKGSIKQNTASDSNVSTMDNYTGMRDVFMHKTAVDHMGTVSAETGNPYGMPVRTEFIESRIEAPIRAANVIPWERQNVGKGLGLGYTNEGAGGYQQANTLDYIRPKSTDELRIVSNPKLSYKTDPVPGAFYVQQSAAVELQPPVPKNRPDTFYISGPERWNTTTGVEKAPRAREDIVVKDQNRESTDNTEYYGTRQSAASGFQSYVRPVLEPLMTFFKLTFGDYFGTSGPAAAGANLPEYSVWKNSKLNDSREQIEAGTRPANGVRQTDTHNKDQRGDEYVRKNEEDYLWDHVTNGSRLNQQASSKDARGESFFRERTGGNIPSTRFVGESSSGSYQRSKNPYHVTMNPNFSQLGGTR